MPFTTRSLVSSILLCGLLHASASGCCIDATQDAAANTVGSAEPPAKPVAKPPAKPLAKPLGTGTTPDENTALDGFLAARAWLDADALPALDAQAAQIELPATNAVCVLLRLNGRLVGVGEDATGDRLMLRRATGRAVVKALGDETIRSVRATLGDKVTARLSLEIELAGEPTPLLGRNIADAAARIVPGRDGIAVRRGETIVRAFPSRLIASDNADRPDGTIAALLVDAGLPAKDLNQYADTDRVSLARFATIRLRESSPGGAPEVITRGGRAIELVEITPNATMRMAIQLTTRLAGQLVAAPKSEQPHEKPHEKPQDAHSVDAQHADTRLLGTLNPTADRYDPPFADARQSALAALALAYAARAPQFPEALATQARNDAQRLVSSIALLPDADRPATVDSVCALALCASSVADEDLRADSRENLRAQLAARVRTQIAAHTSIDPAVSPVPAAFAAAASAALGADGNAAEAARIARAILAAFHDRPGTLLQTALPLALLARQSALEPACAAEIRATIASLAEQLAAQQIGADPLAFEGMPADLVGGLFPPSGPRMRVDSECLRHAAAFAFAFPKTAATGAAMGAATGAATGAAKAPAALSLATRRSLRFLAQHTADDPWVGGFRHPEALRGLVRASLATDDCPPEPTIYGLLLAVAALEQP